jgi:hypothetical protein
MRALAMLALAACSFPAKNRVDGGGDDADVNVDAATPFGCSGRPFGMHAPPEIAISGSALDFGLGTPIASTGVSGTFDIGGSVFTTTTDNAGNFSTVVATNGNALTAHVELSAGTYVSSFFYPAHPFDADTITPLASYTPAELAQVGNPDNTALMQMIIGDCTGARLAGCTVNSTPSSQKIEYTTGGILDSTATATDSTGYVLVFGVPPGTVVLAATCPIVGAMRPSSIPITGNSMYFVELGP